MEGGCVLKGGVNKVDAGRLRELRGVVREGHPVNAARSGEGDQEGQKGRLKTRETKEGNKSTKPGCRSS